MAEEPKKTETIEERDWLAGLGYAFLALIHVFASAAVGLAILMSTVTGVIVSCSLGISLVILTFALYLLPEWIGLAGGAIAVIALVLFVVGLFVPASAPTSGDAEDS